jgi:hypothetical protein
VMHSPSVVCGVTIINTNLTLSQRGACKDSSKSLSPVSNLSSSSLLLLGLDHLVFGFLNFDL